MTITIEIDHKNMHSIRSAAAETGYSRDHITTLARGRKIVAAQIGRQWYVDLDSLKRYVALTSLEQQVKQKHLSEDRRLAQDLTKRISAAQANRTANTTHHHRRTNQAVAALGILLFFAAGSLSAWGSAVLPVGDRQVASSQATATQADDVMVMMGNDVVPVATTFSDGSVEVHVLSAPHEAIVLLPELTTATASAFSDEVAIITASSGESRIVPVGRPAEEGLQFVTLPISEVPLP